MRQTVVAATRPGELPYALYRYRGGAPPGEASERIERRWARALQTIGAVPESETTRRPSRLSNVCAGFGGRSSQTSEYIQDLRYSSTYDWRMRPSLAAMCD